MAAPKSQHLKDVEKYVRSIISGKKPAGEELLLACARFNRDRKDTRYDFRVRDAEFCINIIESTLVHKKGEQLDGTPLKGKPLLLQPWQKFIIYNLLGFFFTKTNERRYKEAFIYIPRKNGKTTFIAALAWSLSLLHMASGSTVLIVGAALKQARQSFDYILHNLRQMGEIEQFRVLDNNAEHSMECSFYGDDGTETGSIRIEALAANPDSQDSFSCNIGIADEMHAYKSPKQYNIIKESQKGYTNKLMIGITTAGDKRVSFCYRRLQYCIKVLKELVADESIFAFIAKAEEDEQGDVDFTNAHQHELANPNYGVTIRPADIMNDALQALNDPQQRKDFLAKSLNVYTSATRAYFNINEFRSSDQKYSWTLAQLAKLPIKWYGGADLSKMHDLTTAALYGEYKGVDIIVTHGWFPRVAAQEKADKDGIPLFGR